MTKNQEPLEPDVPLGMGDKYVRTKINKKTGAVTVEAFGFEDDTCHMATHQLETRLGRVEDTTRKDDGSRGNFQGIS